MKYKGVIVAPDEYEDRAISWLKSIDKKERDMLFAIEYHKGELKVQWKQHYLEAAKPIRQRYEKEMVHTPDGDYWNYREVTDLCHELTYMEYMASDVWDKKRRRILKRDDYTCQHCRATNKPLDVHHLTYKHLFKEPLKDLISLCRDCHDRCKE